MSLEGYKLQFDLCPHRLAYTSHDLGEIAYVYQLEEHKLRFDFCHCWSAHKNDTL